MPNTGETVMAKSIFNEPIVDDSSEMEDFGSAQSAIEALESGSFGYDDTDENDTEAVDASAYEDSEDEHQEESLFDDEGEDEAERSEDSIPSGIAEVEIKAAKGLHKFKLDPNDEELIKTLQLGVGARPAFSKAAKLEKEINELKSKSSEYESAREKAQMIDDFQELANKGFYEQAIKAMLGEEAYDQFRRGSIISHIDYENASPEERFEMDKQRMEQDRRWSEMQKEKELDRKTRELEELRSQALEDKWMGIGTKLLSKYSMDAYVDDPVLAEEYNEELWASAWNTMEALYPDNKDWTPTELEKIFRKKARLFRGGLEKQVEGRLNKATEAKKAKAKEQAQMAARQNYTSNTDDVRSKIKQSASALERLNFLSGLK